MFCVGVVFAQAQGRVVRIQPDVIAAGMTVAFEVFASEKDSGAFGTDGIYLPDQKIALENPSDTMRALFGPVVVSWKGRLIQMPVTIFENAPQGQIQFRVKNGASVSPIISFFRIVNPDPKVTVSGSTVIGDPFTGIGKLSPGNVMVVQGLEITSSSNTQKVTFSTYHADSGGNPRYHPVIILSKGPVVISNSLLSVSADSLNGGPGGGGGGGGFSRAGGAGFTGGGSDSEITVTNIGSGDGPSFQIDGSYTGGASLTGVTGGVSDFSDQGGGGGTGSPFGSSGRNGRENNLSPKGGFGGGSAGGEELNLPYGGGGGGYITKGEAGKGGGDNGGNLNGGRFLVPLQGGSGGGAGNCYECNDSLTGSGGGGGGALTIVSFQRIDVLSATIHSNGNMGTSAPEALQAGGGGGSGGAIYLSARERVKFSSSTLQSTGGSGGKGGSEIEETTRGGNGGKGIIRIDGDTTFIASSFDAGSLASGPTLHIPDSPVSANQLHLSGTAGNMIGLKDSIRIYYRSSRSSWKYVDTIRITDMHWQKFIESDYDSVLYVTVFQKTEEPQRRFANYEPEWLLSHLSSGIVDVVPRPSLRYSPDTIRVGCTKISECDSTKLYLQNVGSLPLTIDSLHISGTDFAILASPVVIRQFSRDSVIIRYCPTKAGSDTALLSLFTNDSSRRIVIIGCGTSKDLRITMNPSIHHFGRRALDTCVTKKIVIMSVGDDTVTIDPQKFSNPQFTVLSPTSPIKLSKGKSDTIVVQYCPRDTGVVRSSVIITEQRDSIVVTGIGILKKLTAIDTMELGVLCNGRCLDTLLRITSVGNEPVIVSSLVGASELSPIFPITLQPGQHIDIPIRVCPDSLSQTQQPLTVVSDADTSFSTILMFSSSSPNVTLREQLNFQAVCIGGADTILGRFINATSADVVVRSASLGNNIEITSSAISTPMNVASGDSLNIEFYFNPSLPDAYFDTLEVSVSSNGCDTLLRFPLSGFASNGQPLLSRNEIDFGVVDTSGCVRDSLIITNVCLSPITISFPSLTGVYHQVSAQSSPLQIVGGGSDTLIYEYCPDTDKGDTLTLNFTDGFGVSYAVRLSGKGRIKESHPHITLQLPSMNVVSGTVFDYTVTIDSARDELLLDSLIVTLAYDPIVVQPVAIVSGQQGIVTRGIETTPGIYTFAVSNIPIERSKSIASISFMPLLSKHTSTPVSLSASQVFPNAIVTANEGRIDVERCEDPPQNIIIPGDFSLAIPTPNPTNAFAELTFEIGAEGSAAISVSNSSGSVLMTTVIAVRRGRNKYLLDLTSLPTGRYRVTIDSWGWRDSKSLIIIK